MKDIWAEYRTIALNKLPKEGGLREVYDENWWEGPNGVGDDFECIPRLVKLLEDYPELTQRDIFAICQTHVVNDDKSEVSNVPIVPMEEGHERSEKLNSIIVAICKKQLDEEEPEEDDVPKLKKALKDAKEGLFENLDPVFQLLADLGMNYWSAAIEVAWAMGMRIESDAGECETNPMVAWLVRVGFATTAVNYIDELRG